MVEDISQCTEGTQETQVAKTTYIHVHHIQTGKKKKKDNVTIPRTRGKHTFPQRGIGEMTGSFPLEIYRPEDNGMPFLKC